MWTHIIAIIFFLIASTHADPPPNDSCANAYQIDITSPTVITGDTNASTVNKRDYYTFTPTFNTTLNMTVCNTGSNSFDVNFILYQGNCTQILTYYINTDFKSCKTFDQIPVIAGEQYIYYIFFYYTNSFQFSSYNITHLLPAAPTSAPTMAPSNYPTKTPSKTPSVTIVTSAPVLAPVATPTSTEDTTCGLFGFNFFCPRRGNCGFWERLLGLGDC